MASTHGDEVLDGIEGALDGPHAGVEICNRLPPTQTTHILLSSHSIPTVIDAIFALERSSWARASSSLFDDSASLGQRTSMEAARAEVAASIEATARHQRSTWLFSFT